ncbi:MAG: carboxypeptidase regulatory-like domain-containing protein, partial [Crocinitomicaceae bacterium]|nr:carboxypeptidase regulatory-like domain-containing protein [Crocinitomicaceae bacterium]
MNFFTLRFPCSVLILILTVAVFSCNTSFAQPGRNGGQPSTAKGKIYGKVIDASSGKSLEYVVLQLFQKSTADSSLRKLITGALSESNGDFNLVGVPTGEKLVLTASMVGFTPLETEVFLNGSGGIPEKDVGNLRLEISAMMNTVEIIDSTPDFRMEFDKRIYDVSKNPANAGGTAEDVLRNIPSVQVDMDGNVSMRNNSPQIFIDGRPTTLTIDQVPADDILRVEVITNPSARYDASGGGGGIINIVMKHNKAFGYNGNVRVGVDKRGKINSGFNINVREKKINFFLNGNVNQRKNISTGTTTRHNFGETETLLQQSQQNINNGLMMNGKFGLDWFMD